MTDQLARIEALLESTGQTLARTAAQQEKNTEDIDTLLGAIATTEANVQKLTTKATDTDQLFETLRAEARADRQETRQMWNDAVIQMEQDREAARASTEADRQKSDTRFNEALNRIDAQQEVIQRLMIELINTNRDATKLRDRVDNLEQAS